MSELAVERLPRSELAEWVKLLRGEGWGFREIAGELCISRSYASSLYHDPEGRQDKERKRRYGGTCEGCGAHTDGSNGRAKAPKLCAACEIERQHEERTWTRQEIIRVFREFAAIMGRPPAAADYMVKAGGSPSLRCKLSPQRIAEADRAFELGLRLPAPSTVKREFGGWREALHTASLPITPGGAPQHRIAGSAPIVPEVGATIFQRGEFVCPSCGDFTTVLYDVTGWCGACTRMARDAA